MQMDVDKWKTALTSWELKCGFTSQFIGRYKSDTSVQMMTEGDDIFIIVTRGSVLPDDVYVYSN